MNLSSLWQPLSDDVIVIALFVSTGLSYALSCLWERCIVPRLFFHEEVRLVRWIAQLQDEAERLNQMNTMTLYSKTQRKILTLRKELAEVRKERYRYTVDVNTMLMSPLWFDKPSSSAKAMTGTAAERRTTAGTAGHSSASLADQPEESGSPSGTEWSTFSSGHDRGNHRAPGEQRRRSLIASFLSRLPAAYAEGVQNGFLFARYNLPDVIKYVLRYHPIVLAWLLWGQREAFVLFPRCIATQLPLTLLGLIPLALNLMMYGPAGYSASKGVPPEVTHAPQTEQTPAATAAASVPHCSPLVWALLCSCVVWYAIRVFS